MAFTRLYPQSKIFKTFANSLIILAFVLTGAGKYVPANPIIIKDAMDISAIV